MVAANSSVASDYIVVLRLIQPARIQDILRMFPEVLGVSITEELAEEIKQVHLRMKNGKRLISVRRGTYILDAEGMNVASSLIKERNLDNARLFLMKNQRKAYHKHARWLG